MRVWKGRRFENILKLDRDIMTSVDADLRSGCRLETGRRSESIIYIYIIELVPLLNIAEILLTVR